MTLRSAFSPFLRGIHRRQFHFSRVLYDATHYDTLQVPTDATAADIKKSFYALSKTHHPDRNPNDATASSRFVKISDAYAVLGSPEKRQRYDRDFLPRAQPNRTTVPTGSYSSSGAAGGRPASGLSKRRTPFQGPPPSFYRSGGWGAHSAKRGAAAEETANNAKAQTDHHNVTGQPAYGGGMGPGRTPWGDGGDVPHFDKEGHLRTHSNHEERRRQRSSRRENGQIELPPGMLASFVAVCGVVGIGIFVPSFVFERLTRRSKKEN